MCALLSMEWSGHVKGFSLLEMLLALALVSIMLSVGVPSWQSMIRDSTVSGLAQNYLRAFNTARHASVYSTRTVSICALDDVGRCSGKWGRHFSVFYDDDRNGVLAGQADLIEVADLAGGEDVTVSFRAFGGSRFVSLRKSGQYRQNGTFRFCPAAGGRGRAIIINVVGRARVEKIACD